ncbi:hypothetical protein SLS60_006098 [Paraconiothyrium brasiliense]|uniref:F-box domain-containing protein n=1 Tax=Paraconiothyrium brasiliense TaxID=300254 RepID=A0ABR3RE18_9PLEO
MGYSEVLCRLCGVTFNIGRRRLRSEPAWMGWQCTGDAKLVGCQLGDGRKPEECVDDVPPGEEEEEQLIGEAPEDDNEREDVDTTERHALNADIEKMLDDEEDDDYHYKEPDKEPLEFESDDEMAIEEDDDHMDVDSSVEDDTYTLFNAADLSLYTTDLEKGGPPPKHKCFRGAGYSGKLITAEEMKGCNTAQCLLTKAHLGIHEAAPDDQDFERGGQFCLSGLCGHVRSRDCGGEEFVPPRHGISDAIVDSWDLSDRDTAVPFHTACFDIFSRLSRKQFGYVNFEALGNWMFDSNEDVDLASSDRNVRESSEQWWAHRDGCEYLAANPLLIPRLGPILKAAIAEDDGFDPQNGAFDVPVLEGNGDVFSSLPLELRLQTLSYLASSDIAHLRLASRTFRQLPILLWRDLLLREMPYLWEVWSDDLPFIWATTTWEDAVHHEQTEGEWRAWLYERREIIKSDLPEILDAWEADVQRLLSQRVNDFLAKGRVDAMEKMVTRLPASRTNWYEVYVGITRNWKDLKGLQNRRRIWKDIGAIVEKLNKYAEAA